MSALSPMSLCALAVALLLGGGSAFAGGTLIYCSEGSPAGFDPARHTAGTDFDASAETVFNRLVEFERGSTQIRPALAEKWEIAPDGLSYTFHLRRGVKFHTTPGFKPTRDFGADDVLFSFLRLIDRNHPFNRAAPVDYPYVTDMGLDGNIAGIDKLDTHTVRLRLRAVDAALLQKLAMSFASIQSAEYAELLLKTGKPAQLNTQPVGTGPFVFKSYQKDASIRFDGNRTYWRRGEVLLDRLLFVITPDAGQRYQKLQRGECHIMAFPRPADLQAMQGKPQLAVPSQAGFNLAFLAYNVRRKPLDQLAVRQALDMAINKQAILAAVYRGGGMQASNPLPPTQWSYNRKLKDPAFDPARARALLTRAGVKDGTEITLWAMPVQRPYNPNARLMAEMIQADWARIGIRARIVSHEWSEYLRRGKNGEHDSMLVGWNGDNGDPDNWLGVNLGCSAIGGNNYAQWCNKDFDALIVRARTLTNQAERSKLYEKAQEIFKQELPWTTIAHATVYQPMRKEVQGFRISPFNLMSFYGVSLQ
ncbi:ABC transporter substrate-binding protein [Chitinilyticum litopenaei]|uniref:ABC transporter substrate-binding protein n=1 Tax=Chitinilyticum litopenaei TaxID=1121276 RepID=UPI0003FEA36F|nr:ABC transporter substrate-binding protein [Chitinilyticum litopenaei]